MGDIYILYEVSRGKGCTSICITAFAPVLFGCFPPSCSLAVVFDPTKIRGVDNDNEFTSHQKVLHLLPLLYGIGATSSTKKLVRILY